jgi:tripartite-type tricarboxylate transporter receptor subunit TctC
MGADNRMAILPEVPTMVESGIAEFDANSWYGFFAPAETPKETVSRLDHESAKILRSQEMRDFMSVQGAEAIGDSPEKFSVHIGSELAKWARAVNTAGVRSH